MENASEKDGEKNLLLRFLHLKLVSTYNIMHMQDPVRLCKYIRLKKRLRRIYYLAR